MPSNDTRSGAQALEALQARLIAETLGIPAAAVTVEFIDHLLEEEIYPRSRFDRNSEYGGYSNANLQVFTGDELTAIHRSVEKARRERELAAVGA